MCNFLVCCIIRCLGTCLGPGCLVPVLGVIEIPDLLIQDLVRVHF